MDALPVQPSNVSRELRRAQPNYTVLGGRPPFLGGSCAFQPIPAPIYLALRVEVLQKYGIQTAPCAYRMLFPQPTPATQIGAATVSAGGISLGRPERSTNRIPESTVRFSIGRHPPFGPGRSRERDGASYLRVSGEPRFGHAKLMLTASLSAVLLGALKTKSC